MSQKTDIMSQETYIMSWETDVMSQKTDVMSQKTDIMSQKRDIMSQKRDIMSQETDMILDLEPGNRESLDLKAKALYMLGRFIMIIALDFIIHLRLEEALVFYHRALRGPTGVDSFNR